MTRSACRLWFGLGLLAAGCGPSAGAEIPDAAPAPGDPDAAGPPPPDAAPGCTEPQCSDECAEAALRHSYDGCEFVAVDLDNATAVDGGDPMGGDCSNFGEGIVLLPAQPVCVDETGGIPDTCQYGNDCRQL